MTWIIGRYELLVLSHHIMVEGKHLLSLSMELPVVATESDLTRFLQTIATCEASELLDGPTKLCLSHVFKHFLTPPCNCYRNNLLGKYTALSVIFNIVRVSVSQNT